MTRCDDQNAASTRLPAPSIDPALHPGPPRSLVEEMGSLVDSMRQLAVDAGLRPYRVVAVLQAWSGRQVGVGTPSVVWERELLPTPLIDMAPIKSPMTPAGKQESGSTWIREVSPRYTEDEIEGMLKPDLGPGQESYLEVRLDARDGQTRRRRFTVVDAVRRADSFEWVVQVHRARPDRERDGSLDERTLMPDRLMNPLMSGRGE